MSLRTLHLARAIGFHRRHGMTVHELIPDNGSASISTVHAIACRTLMLAGWAYGAISSSSRDRTAALHGRLWHSNHHRRQNAINRQTPITRLDTLLGPSN